CFEEFYLLYPPAIIFYSFDGKLIFHLMYHSGYFAARLFAASFPSNRRWYLLFGADRWHLQISFALFLYYLHFPGRWKATLQVDDRRKILTSSILLKAIFCQIVPIPSVMLLTGIQTFLCLYPATGLVQ